MALTIRHETPLDREAVHAVNAAAFETHSEADLVEALRRKAQPIVSLVAERDGGIVGHILFSPVTVRGKPEPSMMGLAPMAVMPEHQRKGIGSELVRAGLAECRKRGVAAVAVLGHPGYYPRFGFLPSTAFGMSCEYDVPEEAFMLLELEQNALDAVTGSVRYHEAFDSI